MAPATLLPDPAELDALARRISSHAAAARARAADLGRAANATEWLGSAAGAFALPAHETGAALRRSAERLDDAARALHRHARAVEHTLAVLRQAAIRTGRTVEEVAATLTDLGEGLEGDVTHIADVVLHDAGAAGRTVEKALVHGAGSALFGAAHLVGV